MGIPVIQVTTKPMRGEEIAMRENREERRGQNTGGNAYHHRDGAREGDGRGAAGR